MNVNIRAGFAVLLIVTVIVWGALALMLGQIPTTPGAMLAGTIGGFAGVVAALR